jgi:cold shock CspA family protein
MKKHQGRVSRFGPLGYGFITDSQSRTQYFVHIKDVIGRKELRAGDIVEFEEGPQNPDKAPNAINVEFLGETVEVLS